jgi:predicted nuclease with RNAse H fold
MLFTDSVYIGVDLNSGHKSLTYAALDRDLNLVALTDADMDDTLSFLAGQESAIVAVDAPSNVNHAVVKKNIEADSLTSHSAHHVEMRLAEYELRQRGIAVKGTEAKESLCPAGIRAGFVFYQKLSKFGFESYPNGEASHQWLETNSYACFCALIGVRPLSKSTLEGRLQRELLLYELGLKIHDPMIFFEEITRHKLLNGNLPLELIHSSAQLDAIIAAYTAWHVMQKPADVIQLGHRLEGYMTLPVSALKEKYS